MKKLTLMNLTLKNFKGIKSFELQADGEDARVFGDNATGKTTLFDSFLWLLFGKDSNGRSDFAIKTLEGGKEINNLEHEVSASFLLDGQPLSLRKVYKEKWTRKRNAPTAEFTGHKTDHEVDGVPVSKKEFEERVSLIVQEDVFKLLTSPLYFNEQMKWQDRRKTLLEICGDVAFDDVLAANKELASLPTILKGREIDAHRKVIASRRAKINEELDRIPVRIDEINKSMPETQIDVSSIEVEIAKVEKELDEASTQINNIKNGSAVTEKKNELRQLEMDLESLKRELEAESVEQGYKVQAKIQEEQSNVSILQRKADDVKHRIEMLQKDVSGFDEKLINLRNNWSEEDDKTFEHKEECECPTCGQALPEEQLQAARDKAVSTFNTKKSNELERISSLGKSIGADKDETLKEIEKLKAQSDASAKDLDAKAKTIEKLNAELNELRESVKDARQDPKYQELLKKQTETKEAIDAMQSNVSESIADIEKEVIGLKDKRTKLNASIAEHAQVKASEKRIAELEEQQGELSKEFEELERQLYLTESFIRSKVELLEAKINSKFKYARFKLFSTQVNGGLQEVCETTFEGVPYSSGLNNAARINVGLDIINTLSEHYGIQAPIFVDNAEAVTQLAETESQLISLVVSEQDKQLRIESQAGKENEVA